MADFDAYIVVNDQLYEPDNFETPIDRENHFAYVEQAPITTTKNWHVVENEIRFLDSVLDPGGAFEEETSIFKLIEREPTGNPDRNGNTYALSLIHI